MNGLQRVKLNFSSIQRIINNNSWTLVQRNNTMHVIPSRWILVVKIDANTGKRRYKARFVVKGFKQLNGVDYFDDQVSSSVLAAKSLRIILVIAVNGGYELHHMDAVSAFTQATLDQDIYAEQPEGFEQGMMLVCKLNKAVYGLKQASYLWQKDVKAFMIINSWTPCKLDENLYYRYSHTNHLMMVGTYVDDILSAYHPDDKKEFMLFVDSMKKRFTLKEIGAPTSILGMRVLYDTRQRVLSLDHYQYIDQLLLKYNMKNAKISATPASEELLGPEHCPSMESEKRIMQQQYPYRKLMGELIYLANTSRPDISHIVGVLSRFTENPGKKHWEAAKRVLRYLAGTQEVGLMFHGTHRNTNKAFQIEGYSDADWGRDMHGRKSIYGFIIHLNGI